MLSSLLFFCQLKMASVLDVAFFSRRTSLTSMGVVFFNSSSSVTGASFGLVVAILPPAACSDFVLDVTMGDAMEFVSLFNNRRMTSF